MGRRSARVREDRADPPAGETIQLAGLAVQHGDGSGGAALCQLCQQVAACAAAQDQNIRRIGDAAALDTAEAASHQLGQSGGLEGDGVRNGVDVALVDHHQFRHGAVDAVANGLVVLAEGKFAALAVIAFPAGYPVVRGDAVAGLEVGHALSDLFHDAGKFVSGDDRIAPQHGTGPVMTGICWLADTAGHDTDKDLPVPADGGGNFHDAAVGAAGLLIKQSFHIGFLSVSSFTGEVL